MVSKTAQQPLTPDAALSTMRAARKRHRVIWSPTTLLEAMHYHCSPDYPRPLRHKAKKLLEQLHDAGFLTVRAATHSVRTRQEIAYVLIEEQGHRTAMDKSRVYHPTRGRTLLEQ